jgi:uncharacterized protein (TIGR03435 family)
MPDFNRRAALFALGTAAIGYLFFPGTVEAAQEFEVASVKANNSGSGSSRFDTAHGRLTATNESLRGYIRWAYWIKDYQIVGPAWLASARYDIAAEADSPASDKELMAMLQSLLQNRFKLQVHHETKLVRVYNLVVGKDGLLLPTVKPGRNYSEGGDGHITAQNVSMRQFADTLAQQMNRPVLDKTGAPGVYSFTLDWTPDSAGNNSLNSPHASLFTVLQERMGLKLRPEKAFLDLLVIDRAEKLPTAN